MYIYDILVYRGGVFDISINYSMIYNMSDDDGGGGGECAGCDGGDNGCC